MSFEKDMYEVREKWESSYFSEKDTTRIEVITKMIPDDVTSILDVGCGNGILVNHLEKNYKDKFRRICGVDRSKTSLSFVKTEKYESGIDDLPFEGNAFDIVSCLEVIEHLPLKIFAEAISELQRVASKYIIISVPYAEDLNYSKVRCPKCTTEFNPFYHMHSFDKERIMNIFAGGNFEFVSLKEVEYNSVPFLKHFKKWISRKIHPNSFPDGSICPMCGYNRLSKLKTSYSQPFSKKSSGLSAFWPHYKKTKWVAGLYKRKTHEPGN